MCLELAHQFTVLDIPDGDEARIITTDDRIEVLIITGEAHGSFMTGLDLLLGLERPEHDVDRADDDIVGDRVVGEGRENILGAISLAVDYGLNALVMPSIPDLDDLVCAETNQVVPLLVDVQMGHARVVAVQVGQLLECIRLPENDVALLTTASNLLVLDRVDEAVYTLLMQVECAPWLVDQIGKVVHMDETVK